MGTIGRLADLVRELDGLGAETSLIRLVHALDAAKLTADDVLPYVVENARGYHRQLIARQQHYELLVLTWLPGQGSAPHDHAGSISAMQVVRGQAAEGCWRIAPDGFVDLDYETTVSCGEMTAWQDAGIHSVRNSCPAGSTLVTVHVYAPPLKDFRRFIPRSRPLRQKTSTNHGEPPTIVIVGGGFSGSMTAAQLLRRASSQSSKLRVVLVERQGAVGEGLAYGTRELCHLLNVPAGRMSAWPDRPNDFVEWTSARYRPVEPSEFLPRPWYGEYVRDTLLSTADASADVAGLTVMFDEVRRIARRPASGWMVNFARGLSIPATAVVLAIGHRPPPDPIGRLWSGPRNRFIADPWRPFAAGAVRPDHPIAILGSGLTAVDAVLSLAQEPRQMPITLISRRGLVPQSHAATAFTPADLQPLVAEMVAAPGGVDARLLFKRVRKLARELADMGADWRSVVDGLRPHTSMLWNGMPAAERRRFLTRLRPYWEVHRHRMALDVAEKFHRLVSQGLVRIVSGSVASAQAHDDGVRLYVRERGEQRLLELNVAWVINCTGPAASNSAESNPAIGSLLVHGWVRPDELGLGLETSTAGHAVDVHNAALSDLIVVGTLRKPALWETTAVPELRAQAAAIAELALRQAVASLAGS